MHTALELTLSHDGCDWCTDDMGYQLRGEDLAHLEESITRHIRIDPRFIDDEAIVVTLLFDLDQFPRWLIQYQPHYFNHSFTIKKEQQVKS